jgi:hypothetical protein
MRVSLTLAMRVNELVARDGPWGFVLRIGTDDDLVAMWPEASRGDHWRAVEHHAATAGQLLEELVGGRPWTLLRNGEPVLAGHGREIAGPTST